MEALAITSPRWGRDREGIDHRASSLELFQGVCHDCKMLMMDSCLAMKWSFYSICNEVPLRVFYCFFFGWRLDFPHYPMMKFYVNCSQERRRHRQRVGTLIANEYLQISSLCNPSLFRGLIIFPENSKCWYRLSILHLAYLPHLSPTPCNH